MKMENTKSATPYALKAVLLAIGISLLHLLFTYSPGFLLGNGPFWDLQIDDTCTYITGLRFYIRDEWRFPLFYAANMNFPDGTNIAFTDSLPLLALPAKVIYKITGFEWNYFGHWFIISNAFFALSIAALLDSLRVRSLAVLSVALCLGFAVFPYLARTFHFALSSHFIIIAALSLYFYAQSRWSAATAFAGLLLLSALALLIHFYLFIMAALVAAACFLDLAVRKKNNFRQLCLYASLAAAAIILEMLLIGYLSLEKSKAYGTFGTPGIYSMNMLSPFTPVKSMFFTKPWFADPTGKQFTEGMNYLGISVVVLLAFIVIRFGRDVKKSVCNYPWLTALCLGLFVFALSNKIYFAGRLVLEIPLIPGVQTLYSTFQSTGRFFWIAVYLLTFGPLVFLWNRPFASRKILLAGFIVLALLQNAESWKLRRSIFQKTAAPAAVESFTLYEQLVRQHQLILVSKEHSYVPGAYRTIVRAFYYCAGQHNVPINYAYTARNLLRTTSLEELIAAHCTKDKAVLLIVPEALFTGEIRSKFRPIIYEKGIIISTNKPFHGG